MDRSDVVVALNDLARRGLADRFPEPSYRRRNIIPQLCHGQRAPARPPRRRPPPEADQAMGASGQARQSWQIA